MEALLVERRSFSDDVGFRSIALVAQINKELPTNYLRVHGNESAIFGEIFAQLRLFVRLSSRASNGGDQVLSTNHHWK